MIRGKLTAAEARAGGVRLEGSARTQEGAARAPLVFARRQLKRRRADASGLRTTLTAPNAATPARWQKGARPIPPATHERVAIVLALHRRCFEAGDIVSVTPLPALHRPGRAALPASDILAASKLSDLLGLWRQFALQEEPAEKAVKRGRRRS